MRNTRQIRNPRYAPEFLERKLSPTCLFGGTAAPAIVVVMDNGSGTVDPNTIPGTLIPPDIDMSGPPTGPVLPA